ncbi:MAG: hypothetical protein HYU25_10255 [Candidatus Rokubacteria bacterium]|nr:hypothetical protein [Candidatus Rokubacteria bacterium]
MPLARPVVSALLLCDLIIREEGTHKASLIGIVRSISAPRFPANLGELWVYPMVTDAEGEYRLRLDLVRLQDLSIRVESPGLYNLHLLANERLIGTRTFNVVQSLEDF